MALEYFKGSTALITGASAGIGVEMARLLAPLASRLILVARRRDRLVELAAELMAENEDLEVFPREADLADPAQVEALVGWVKESRLPLDLLVNNAGLGDHGPFQAADWARVRAMLDVNVVALTRLTHGLLPVLAARPQAAVLNVSSIASLIPVPDMAVYAATKAYVTSFTEALRIELADSGVRVTALCPGPVDTEFGEVAKRSGEEDHQISPALFKMPAETVAREGLEAVAQDRPRVIPGWIVWASMTVTALLPMAVLRLILAERRRAQ